MPTHVTARLAWHSDGWNGSVCKSPAENTYCVGPKSYPGDVIARERDLENEMRYAGCSGKDLDGYIPPCCYSYNAFGLNAAQVVSAPPDFFNGRADQTEWTLPPSTVCIWPFEAMYTDEVKKAGYYDNDRRRELAREFFAPIERDCGSNLIFYYANYSNPLSEEEAVRYAVIGVSRITRVGEELLYNNVQPDIAEKYAGGLIWSREITSAYPDEGIRLPYHRYIDEPQRLAEIAVYPENPQICKYGSKHLSDDEAIGLLEQLLAKVRLLKEIDDETENWTIREEWLLKTIAELWTHRGLYPGLLKVLDVAGASRLVDGVKEFCISEGHDRAHNLAFDAIENDQDNVLTQDIDATSRKEISRNWKLLDEDAKSLLRDILPRFDLDKQTINDVANDREGCGLTVPAEEITANPYLLAELYRSADQGEPIPWSTIDRGTLPSPDLGGTPLAGVHFNDERRFRSLCVEHLRSEPNHTFRLSKDLIEEVRIRMARLPEWKQAQFNARYFEVDEEFLSESLKLRPFNSDFLLYDRLVYEDERLVEMTLKELATRPELSLRRPVTSSDWSAWIVKTQSTLGERGGEDYVIATNEQKKVCERLFRQPISVVTGPAGTGKTTVIESLVRAVRKSEGEEESVLVMAPTGKAADRARQMFDDVELTDVKTVTVHSFLASYGWLNKNLTFRRLGGKHAALGTLILDEASMLDLELTAALFRAIDWQHVRRLILVGDTGQLPPIGRGRVFVDVVKWLETDYPQNLGRLQSNLRLMLNKIEGKGQSILKLAELFMTRDEDKTIDASSDESTDLEQESLIEQIHEGGEVDEALDVIFWHEPERLASTLIKAIEIKMKNVDEERAPYEIWREGLADDPTAFQILSPHRADTHGVEALNDACQKRRNEFVINRVGCVDGVTLFDKVIQVRNRPKSDPIWAYDRDTKEQIEIEIFNGEIGVVGPIGFDSKIWRTLKTGYGPRLRRFAVEFTRKPGITVGYGNDVPNGSKFKRNESVEENLELAYAVSVHKAQGSEFGHTFVIIPASKKRPVSAELVYTALTRASRHCTLLIENDISSLLDARRRENTQTRQINSSLFELHLVKGELTNRDGWYEAGKIHEALSGDMLRSKSEVIIANILHDRQIPFLYEKPLFAGDGSVKLPDFTVAIRGKTYFWEHLGRLDLPDYAQAWSEKQKWYEHWFPGQLLTTEEGKGLSKEAVAVIDDLDRGPSQTSS
ncbi:MAG: AAA family ATPase [Gammaproteobacteria bacterium]|nr:AAA family ATPase [Gammaproteobacteria bacterium]